MGFNIAKTNKKRVVIIGGGFGGVKLANKLKGSNFQVVLIDKNNFHQFPAFVVSGSIVRAGTGLNHISFPEDIPEAERLLFPDGGSESHHCRTQSD